MRNQQDADDIDAGAAKKDQTSRDLQWMRTNYASTRVFGDFFFFFFFLLNPLQLPAPRLICTWLIVVDNLHCGWCQAGKGADSRSDQTTISALASFRQDLVHHPLPASLICEILVCSVVTAAVQPWQATLFTAITRGVGQHRFVCVGRSPIAYFQFEYEYWGVCTHAIV